jgi:hypothetical protein
VTALALICSESWVSSGQPNAPRATCLDSIPAAALKRIPVYVAAEASGADAVTQGAVVSMDLLTQAVAEHARALLGAGPGQLPPGEPTITWRQLEHQVQIVAHRDGRMTWRVERPGWLSERSSGDSAAHHLVRALTSARAKGEAFLWDDALRTDSLTWLIRLEPATLGEDGTVTPPSLRAGFPVFSVLAPPMVSADVEQMRTNYPMVRIRGFSGTVRLQFVIDTTGRAVSSTIRDVWPSNEARLVGPPRFAYDSVVRVMQIALGGARFVPARIGRCSVSQLVQQAFTYRPAR